MKPIHALAVMGALVAGPALAQQSQQVPSDRPNAVVMGVEAVQPQFMAQIQQELQSQGYYRGQVDGVFGDQTQAALAAWQRDHGIQPSGQLNRQTLAQLDVGQAASQQQQQAENPYSGGENSNIVDLKQEHMSSPNVRGEPVPEQPDLGTPEPNAPPRDLQQEKQK